MIRILFAITLIIVPCIKSYGGDLLCPMNLASQPAPSGYSDYRARYLDDLEASLYERARSKKILWVQLVDEFYTKCSEVLQRNSQGIQNFDRRNIKEIMSYQRFLAEQMDARKITESEWAYLQEKKFAEIRARNQLIENASEAYNH